jgi:hypothetical protein
VIAWLRGDRPPERKTGQPRDLGLSFFRSGRGLPYGG